MTLDEFLIELKKPRHKRKWIDKKTYRKLMLEYRMSPEVTDEMHRDRMLRAKNEKSLRFRRW